MVRHMDKKRAFHDFDHDDFLRVFAGEDGQRAAQSFLDHAGGMPFCNGGVSPIEVMFGCGLLSVIRGLVDIWAGIEEAAFSTVSGAKLENLTLAPVSGVYAFYQVGVGNYRVDFIIAVRTLEKGTAFYVAECDGHEFHERTKDQAQRDKSRDRYLQSRGLQVFRFTGTEVRRDPIGCAQCFVEDCLAAHETRFTDVSR